MGTFHRHLIHFESFCSFPLLQIWSGPSERGNMDMEKLLTKEKLTAISEKIANGLEENKIVGCANMLVYAIRESWLAGFEEGRKYPKPFGPEDRAEEAI